MDIKISGYYTQNLEALMPPNEVFYAESGAMTMYEEGIEMNVQLFKSGIKSIIKRLLTKESISLVRFNNYSSQTKKLILSSNSFIIPIKIDEYSNEIICAKSAFFASSKNINFSIDLDDNLGTGLFSGFGLIRQKITGNGTVFLKSHGDIKKVVLNGARVVIDSSAILAFTNQIQFSNSIKNPIKNIFSGEGISQEELSGFGTVWIQCYNDPVKSSPMSTIYNTVIWSIMIIYLFS